MNRVRVFNLDCGSRTLRLSERTHVMGILNVTPDSFYDGGRYFNCDRAVERALEIAAEGADLIDIGGESTRPGAEPLDVREEMKRVIPVIEGLQGKISIPISIDTRKSQVAEAAFKAGASLVNDISALRDDPNMASVVAKYRVPVVLMHMKGTPRDMQKNPEYDDLMGEIYLFLEMSVRRAVKMGIQREKIIVDPGIGFGKKWEDNFVILKRMQEFLRLDCPLMVGVSRKSFIGLALEVSEDERLMGTAGAVATCVMQGAHIVRVHDVKEMVQVVRIADRIKHSH
ncbi:MAG: dihydropteroate synthase [bacterium]